MYKRLKKLCKGIIQNRFFEYAITIIIIINSILIGVETSFTNEYINIVQKIILTIFTIEIVLRFIAADNIKSFFKDGWNIFDLILVIIGYIPPTIASNASSMMALRVLRVFRVLRLLRATKEIKLIITVLIRSMTSMIYNVILFIIFIYLFAIIGVGLFRLPDPETSTPAQKAQFELYVEKASNVPRCAEDPFDDVGEGMFTLFRELTGDAWADVRYNSILAYEMGLIKTGPAVTNIFHIVWVILSAFLLLNIVTGAIINNYQEVIDEYKKEK